MRPPRRHSPARATRGSALTEFVVVVPVMIAMIYGSMHLMELGTALLDAQEIARFGAWEMAAQPLSDYAEANHGDLIRNARQDVPTTLWRLYDDLDATRRRPGLGGGRQGMIMAAHYLEPSSTDISVRPVEFVPGAANADFGLPAGGALSLLGVGSSVGNMVSRPLQVMGFNTRGLVRSRARVQIRPPFRPRDLARSQALASQGKARGADMTAFGPGLMSRPLHESAGGSRDGITTVLIVDSWRLLDGGSAHPGQGSPYASAVERVGTRVVQALPFGQLGSLLSGGAGNGNRLVQGLGAFFGGIPPDAPAAHTFARPYSNSNGREGRPDPTGGQPLAGQVDLFAETNGRPESGAVILFETMPLYDSEGGGGDYAEALGARGSGWLGCPEQEKRRCRW